MKRQLHRLWRRVVFCTRGKHRETIDCARSDMLRERCVDCGHTSALGWVFRWASNKLDTYRPWEGRGDS